VLSLTDEQRALLEGHFQEVVIWLTSVRPDGQPQTSPVWFVWDEDPEEFLIYSMPASQKVPNIRTHPKVSLNFRGDEMGGDVATIEGEARLVPAGAAAAVMLAVHAVLSGRSWPVDLVVTGVAGGVTYVAVLLAAGLTSEERGAVTRILRQLRRGPAPS
jgi:PPOX class probable F420-dependent enzyme